MSKTSEYVTGPRASSDVVASIESVADILERELQSLIVDWLARVEQEPDLKCIPLSFEERTGHLPNLLADVIHRLRLPPNAKADISIAARQHGDLRLRQGYTAAMVVEESRILQVSIFKTLQNHLPRVDFSKVLLDVITIADEVDSQLKQAMLSYIQPGGAVSANTFAPTLGAFAADGSRHRRMPH